MLHDLFCLPNMGPEDENIYVPGLTQEHKEEIHTMARTAGRRLYWPSRHNDYFWCRRAILKFAPKAKEILDIGSGASYWPLYIRDCTEAHVTAVDRCSEDVYGRMYKELIDQRVEDDRVTYETAGIEGIQENRKFDVVVSISAIEHFEGNAYGVTTRIIQNTLKRGGMVVLTTDVGDCPGAKTISDITRLLMTNTEDGGKIRNIVDAVTPGILPNMLFVCISL